MKIRLTISLLLISLLVKSQQFLDGAGVERPIKKFEKIETSKLEEINGVYQFGVSEGESELLINKIGQHIIVQIKFREFVSDSLGYIIKSAIRYHTIQNIKLENDRILGDNFEGHFYNVENHYKTFFGLHVIKIDFDLISPNEFGAKISRGQNFYEGNDLGSSRLLTEKELLAHSPLVLKIIRNSIYARYGYDFKSGGEMEEYFEKNDWYYPSPRFSEKNLSIIEKENITKIVNIERQKNAR